MHLILSGHNLDPARVPHKPGPIVDLGGIGMRSEIGPEGHPVLFVSGERFPFGGESVLDTPVGPTDYISQVAVKTEVGGTPASNPVDYDAVKAWLGVRLNAGNLTDEEHRTMLETINATRHKN